MEIVYGIISGIVTALGMGGGTILILLLNLFASLEEHEIQGINLVFFIPTAIVACIINKKRNMIELNVSKRIIIFGIIGSILGSWMSFKINSENLKKCFGIFLILIAIYEIYKIFLQYKRKNN